MYIESPYEHDSNSPAEHHHRHNAPGTVPNSKEKNTGPVKGTSVFS